MICATDQDGFCRLNKTAEKCSWAMPVANLFRVAMKGSLRTRRSSSSNIYVCGPQANINVAKRDLEPLLQLVLVKYGYIFFSYLMMIFKL